MNNFCFEIGEPSKTEEKEGRFYEIKGFVAGKNPKCGHKKSAGLLLAEDQSDREL
jgi:hypothetical protein